MVDVLFDGDGKVVIGHFCSHIINWNNGVHFVIGKGKQQLAAVGISPFLKWTSGIRSMGNLKGGWNLLSTDIVPFPQTQLSSTFIFKGWSFCY